MLSKLRDLIEKLQVYPENMQRNLGLTKGLYFSQSILLALTRAGANRQTAYEAVQRAAMRTWKGDKSFAENAKQEAEITALLSPDEIDALCSFDVHFRHVDETFKSLGLE
jgi:adenylosuccinate lyase